MHWYIRLGFRPDRRRVGALPSLPEPMMTDSPADLSAASCPDAVVRPVLRKILIGFRRGHREFSDAPKPDELLCVDPSASVATMHAFLSDRSVKEIAVVGLGNNAEVTWNRLADAEVIRACVKNGEEIVAYAAEHCDFFGQSVRGDLLSGRGGKLF